MPFTNERVYSKMKKKTPAQVRKSLSRPASSLKASELDTRREVTRDNRMKQSPPAKKKSKPKGNTIGTTIDEILKRGNLPK